MSDSVNFERAPTDALVVQPIDRENALSSAVPTAAIPTRLVPIDRYRRLNATVRGADVLSLALTLKDLAQQLFDNRTSGKYKNPGIVDYDFVVTSVAKKSLRNSARS